MHPFKRMPDGRELRRLEKRAAKRQPQPARPFVVPQILKADRLFHPLDATFAQLELRGELDADADGTAIFRAHDGVYHPLADGINEVAEFFSQWAQRHRQALDLSPLTQLAALIDYDHALDERTFDDVKALLPRLRAIAGRMRPDEADSLVQGTLIANGLDVSGARSADAT